MSYHQTNKTYQIIFFFHFKEKYSPAACLCSISFSFLVLHECQIGFSQSDKLRSSPDISHTVLTSVVGSFPLCLDNTWHFRCFLCQSKTSKVSSDRAHLAGAPVFWNYCVQRQPESQTTYLRLMGRQESVSLVQKTAEWHKLPVVGE